MIIVMPMYRAGARFCYLSVAGLQDGIFSNQKSLFGYILEIFGIGNVGIFCGHLEYFSTIWYVSCPFGIFCAHLVTFSPFWYVVSREIWQPRSVAQTPRGTEKMLLKVNHQVSVFPVLHEVLVELGDPHGPLRKGHPVAGHGVPRPNGQYIALVILANLWKSGVQFYKTSNP
jgi:hypothetical protein